MLPEARKLLTDVDDAAKSISHFMAGKGLAELQGDDLLRSAVYFKFAIIGEALAQLRSLDEALSDRVSECRRIIGFRNQVIHGYGGIDDEITWRIIEQKLPILLQDVQLLLHE